MMNFIVKLWFKLKKKYDLYETKRDIAYINFAYGDELNADETQLRTDLIDLKNKVKVLEGSENLTEDGKAELEAKVIELDELNTKINNVVLYKNAMKRHLKDKEELEKYIGLL